MAMVTGCVQGRMWPLALALLLAACAGGPMDNPAALEEPVLRTNWIEGQDGQRLALSSWQPRGAPKAIVLALHGFGDYGPSTFSAAASHWANRGIAVYAYDQRGFGRNASRGRWPGPGILISDAVAASRTLRAAHPGLPLTVIGHSMGGGVVLAAAAEGLAADRLILAAPAITGGGQVNPFLRLGGWGLGIFAADRRFTGDGVVEIWPTDNIDALRRLSRDPLKVANPSGRELYGLVRIMDRAARAAPKVTQPTLTLIGAKDQIFKPERLRTAHDRIAGGAGSILYPDGWHWLFRDLQAERVWADVAAFALTGSVARPADG